MVDHKDQFKADHNMWGRAHSGPRDTSKLLWGMFHTTENTDRTTPDNVAKWQLDTANESSYNVLFGTTGRTVRSNDDDYSPWSAGMPGNRLAVHGSAVGYASRSRDDWLKHPKQIESLAQWAADLHRRYSFPFKWLTVAEVRGQKVKGFTSHGVYWQAIGKAQGMAVRTDPGANFPYDVVLARAKEIVYPPPPAPTPAKKEEEVMSLSKDDLILHQLTGKQGVNGPGWDQLGGRYVADALGAIGEKLGIAGFYDTANRPDKS